MSLDRSIMSPMWKLVFNATTIALLLLVGLAIDFILCSGTGIHPLARTAILVVSLFGFWRSWPWLILLLVQASLFLREPAQTVVQFDAASVAYGLLCLGLVASATAFGRLRVRLGQAVANRLVPQAISSALHGCLTVTPVSSARRLGSIITTLLVYIGAIAVSFSVLQAVPVVGARVTWFRLSIGNENLLWPGVTLVIVIVATLLVLREISWKALSQLQARMLHKSSAAKLMAPDLRLIASRVAKLRQAKQVRENQWKH